MVISNTYVSLSEGNPEIRMAVGHDPEHVLGQSLQSFTEATYAMDDLHRIEVRLGMAGVRSRFPADSQRIPGGSQAILVTQKPKESSYQAARRNTEEVLADVKVPDGVATGRSMVESIVSIAYMREFVVI